MLGHGCWAYVPTHGRGYYGGRLVGLEGWLRDKLRATALADGRHGGGTIIGGDSTMIHVTAGMVLWERTGAGMGLRNKRRQHARYHAVVSWVHQHGSCRQHARHEG